MHSPACGQKTCGCGMRSTARKFETYKTFIQKHFQTQSLFLNVFTLWKRLSNSCRKTQLTTSQGDSLRVITDACLILPVWHHSSNLHFCESWLAKVTLICDFENVIRALYLSIIQQIWLSCLSYLGAVNLLKRMVAFAFHQNAEELCRVFGLHARSGSCFGSLCMKA